MWYMPMHIEDLIASSLFVCLFVCLFFVCFIKQASLLKIIYKWGGGVDISNLWLSFAQQKLASVTLGTGFFLGKATRSKPGSWSRDRRS
jgi:hypothetical protein